MACWEIIVLIITGSFLILPLAVVDYLTFGAIFATAEEGRRYKDNV